MEIEKEAKEMESALQQNLKTRDTKVVESDVLKESLIKTKNELHQLMAGALEKLNNHQALLDTQEKIQRHQKILLHRRNKSLSLLRDNENNADNQFQIQKEEQEIQHMLNEHLLDGWKIYQTLRETELALAQALMGGIWEKQRQRWAHMLLLNSSVLEFENNAPMLITEVEQWLDIRSAMELQHSQAHFVADELLLINQQKQTQLTKDKLQELQSKITDQPADEKQFRLFIEYLYSPRFPPSLTEILNKLTEKKRRVLRNKISNLKDPSEEKERSRLQSELYEEISKLQLELKEKVKKLERNIKDSRDIQQSASDALHEEKAKPAADRSPSKIRKHLKRLVSLGLSSIEILRDFDEELMKSSGAWKKSQINKWQKKIDEISKIKIDENEEILDDLKEKAKTLYEEQEFLFDTVMTEQLGDIR